MTDQHKARSVAADGGTASDSERDEDDKAADANQRVHQHHEYVDKLLPTRQNPSQPLLVKERPQPDRENSSSRYLHRTRCTANIATITTVILVNVKINYNHGSSRH